MVLAEFGEGDHGCLSIARAFRLDFSQQALQMPSLTILDLPYGMLRTTEPVLTWNATCISILDSVSNVLLMTTAPVRSDCWH